METNAAAPAPVPHRPAEEPLPPHIIRDDDLTPEAIAELFGVATRLKAFPRRYAHALEGRYLAVIFEKRSLRTRFTFELGMKTLGGESVFMDTGQQRILDREPICDVARNLARWVDAIALRTFSHATVAEFAQFSSVPVINGLSELFHPCQSLTDYFTLQEYVGDLRQARLAFVGDGNNVAHSLMLCGALVGAHVSVATPEQYPPKAELLALARQIAAGTGATIEHGNDPYAAVKGAHAVYTDVWASMGFEEEAFRALSRDAGSFRRRPARRHVHALPPRPPRRGSNRRSD